MKSQRKLSYRRTAIQGTGNADSKNEEEHKEKDGSSTSEEDDMSSDDGDDNGNHLPKKHRLE